MTDWILSDDGERGHRIDIRGARERGDPAAEAHATAALALYLQSERRIEDAWEQWERAMVLVNDADLLHSDCLVPDLPGWEDIVLKTVDAALALHDGFIQRTPPMWRHALRALDRAIGATRHFNADLNIWRFDDLLQRRLDALVGLAEWTEDPQEALDSLHQAAAVIADVDSTRCEHDSESIRLAILRWTERDND